MLDLEICDALEGVDLTHAYRKLPNIQMQSQIVMKSSIGHVFCFTGNRMVSN